MPLRTENTGGLEPAYRAYEINEANRIVTFAVISAGSDDDAVEQARAMVHERTIELWDRGRLIVRLPPKNDASGSESQA